MTIPQAETRNRGADGVSQRRLALPLIVAAIDVLAVGVLVGLLIGNRQLMMQLAVYREVNMAASSVVMDLMDDFFMPLVLSISAVLLLTMLALGSWILSGIRGWALRLAILALGFLVIVSALWFGLGRRSTATPPLPVTPTPVARHLPRPWAPPVSGFS